METYLSSKCFEEMGETMGKKVLIATVYNPDPVLLAATKLGPDRLILLLDEKPDREQDKALKLIQDSLGKVIEVKTVKCAVYDVVKVASKCVEIIDMQPKEDVVYVNITSGRKTKAIGLLFAAYARHDRVKKIAYNPEEDKGLVVYLPRLSFKLTESQKKILEYVDAGNYASIKELSEKIDLSTAMLYRAIDELKDMDLISVEDGLKLTDAGKIARL
ncbi:CRISPR locus-related DNA-binding protein [Candidatus Woesearchaeota archaeon]|nr:CRISPR locus-related DNA-binding protein [Candidatus Woesearchaeota archaeon]HIH38781.1 CRISPR locus-related DNA-binding protein [Candidatus Woesearchaeota archaeon]HIH49197.1 CRISPR locus-related DNA-binding protein [Candidatus Woesearchaeota archaeon]HIJ03339.1 CRISPR locus-related DNA-binding protein [Candidatus Woesearchaeota archaeon]